MFLKKKATLAAGIASLALLFAACGNGTTETPAAPAPPVAPAPGEPAAPAPAPEAGGEDAMQGEISFLTWNLQNERFTPFFEDLIARFEAEHPGATVRWIDHPSAGFAETLSADAAAGSLPDVMNLGPEHAFFLAQAGHLVNVAEAAPGAAADFLPHPWNHLSFDQIDGGTYAFPWYLNMGPSFFNKAIFDNCGLDSNNLPTNFDELFAQGAILSANCPDKRMISNPPNINILGEAGIPLMNADGTAYTFNGPEGVAVLEGYVELFNAGGMTIESLDEQVMTGFVDFAAGEVAWLPGSFFDLGRLRDDSPEVYENLAIAPRIFVQHPTAWLHSIAVNSASQHPALALEFARFVTNAENQMDFAIEANVFPSTAGGLSDPFFTQPDGTPDQDLRIQVASELPNAVFWRPVTFTGPDDTELREQLALAIIGAQTAQESLDNAVEFSNRRLADLLGN